MSRIILSRLQFIKHLPNNLNTSVACQVKGFHKSQIHEDIFSVQDEQDFKDKVLSNAKPVIVEFHAPWCGPCKQLMPRLEAVVAGLKGEPVDLAKVDIDELPDIAMEFGVGAVPSVLGLKDGKVIDKFVGLQDEDKIRSFITKINK